MQTWSHLLEAGEYISKALADPAHSMLSQVVYVTLSASSPSAPKILTNKTANSVRLWEQ